MSSSYNGGGWTDFRAALGLQNDATPFPWQEDLLCDFRRGVIPSALDIPTGLGKTAVMAIWLIARCQAAKLPRRLVYVVDRRAVVDQATTEAERLRDWVKKLNASEKTAPGLPSPLPISTLRGQHVDNRQWLEDPATPAIIVGTVDMVGSRLLFGGYGVSRKMRPYHAGLLGCDTLVVLDEAHLVPPFEKLLESIASDTSVFGPAGIDGPTQIPTFHLMSLSATGRSSGKTTRSLTERDLEHPIVKKRLGAAKRLILRHLKSPGSEDGDEAEDKPGLVNTLAREAWNLVRSSPQSRIVVFCDSRDIAAKAKSAVKKLAAGDKVEIDSELFVGGRRVFEREEASRRLKDLGFIAGDVAPPPRPTFLFATSAAEVGVDLDAGHMVSDLVAWERMVQRLGRVNRRGNGDAKVVVVVEPPKPPNKKEKEVIEKKSRGDDLDAKESKVFESFEARSRQVQLYCEPFKHLPKDEHGFDVSPGALRKLKQDAENNPALKQVLNNATTPAPLRPALTRALVDAWSLTSLENHPGRPAIDPWLRGWIPDDPPQTAVVWRAHLPRRKGGSTPTNKEIAAFFEAAPPHTSETLETETFRVIEWLNVRVRKIRDRSKNAEEELPGPRDVVAFVLARDGDLLRTLCRDELEVDHNKDVEKKRKEKRKSELAGATIVIDLRLAGLKDGLLEATEDRSPRTADDAEPWLEPGVVRFRSRTAFSGQPPLNDSNWRECLRFAADVSEEGEPRRWLIVDKWRHDAANEESRSVARLQSLCEHQVWAEKRARELATRLNLDETYEEMLAVAAALHDEGKCTRRWQRAFNAPEGGPYAKTRGPINYDLLDGYRHELESFARAKEHERMKQLPEDLQDLALHLIATHHGFGRPVITTSGCEDAPPSVLQERATEVALRFARLQRRWGPWGLAWWEAVLRAADQQASRDNDAADTTLRRGAA